MKELVCVVGPTASGKTRLAVDLALRLNGELVSCDSMQLYAGMAIGTAQPTEEEKKGVPHHMIGIADPREPWSVGKFAEKADTVVRDILARGRLPILAGGTGLYIEALVSGRSFAPFPRTGRREALEKLAEEEGIETLLCRLREVDPQSADRLPPGDRRRIIRALEVWEETGKTITQHNEETAALPPRYDAAWLGLRFEDRADLYARIDRRVDDMMSRGLLSEAQALLAAGIGSDSTAMQAIGYKELLPALTCGADPAAAVEKIKQSSRHYAKRQMTWFRRREEIAWITLPREPDPDRVLREAIALLELWEGGKRAE